MGTEGHGSLFCMPCHLPSLPTQLHSPPFQMWRQNAPERKKKRDQDSDQSLSDDSESDRFAYDPDCSRNSQSLLYSCHRGRLATTLQVESVKGRLQGTSDVNGQRKSSTSIEKLELFSSELENRIHGTSHEDHQSLQSQPREQHHADSSCESISDEENMVLTKLSVASAAYKSQGSPYLDSVSTNHKGECTWSAIIEESKDLSCLHKKASSSSFISHLSKARKSYKSGRSRAKPKFSICPQVHLGKLPSSRAMNRASESFEEQNDIDHTTLEDSKAELLGYLEEDNQELPAKLVSHELICALPSMAELLEDLEKDGLAAGASNLKLLQNAKAKERKTNSSGRRTTPHLGSRNLDNEDPVEFVGDGTSSGDEDYDQNHLRLAMVKIKQQTMGELFQETFNTSADENPLLPKNRNAGSGYYGRLQQVMQIERDRHLEFLKQSQTGQNPPNDLRCTAVQILSRSLEAKLTVCHCLLAESNKVVFCFSEKKSHQCENDSQKCADDEATLRGTVIFNSRICGSVELEVGSLVRIHPPWKEVLVNKDEKIILCSYFSQIMA